jgi:hypothetical protein
MSKPRKGEDQFHRGRAVPTTHRRVNDATQQLRRRIRQLRQKEIDLADSRVSSHYTTLFYHGIILQKLRIFVAA